MGLTTLEDGIGVLLAKFCQHFPRLSSVSETETKNRKEWGICWDGEWI